MANCPMCGYVWNERTCSTCGWFEGKQPRHSTPRRRLTRKQKIANQQRGESMRAMDRQAEHFNAAVDSGELVIMPVSPLAGEAGCADEGPTDSERKTENKPATSGQILDQRDGQ